jgi:DNA-binding YbaB/EbfC family protein
VSQVDLGQWLAHAQEVQQRVERLRRELATRTVEASAGAGLVTAVATGELRIRELKIDPSLVEGGDRTLLQDLVAAAVNQALQRAQEMVQTELQRVAGGPLGAMAPPGGVPGPGGA